MKVSTMKPLLATALAALTIACANSAFADPHVISGPNRVLDGDTVVVGETHVRLKGVDAAERGTELGEFAREIMIEIVNGSELTCQLTGEKTHKRDVGYCFTTEGVDINRAIIEQGVALACPRFDRWYLPYEQASALEAQPRSSYCIRR
jgi:endonuclease YncB( thermonuclease family)